MKICPLFFIGDFMIDQYFGIKELSKVVLRAKTPMNFGSRHLEADEPVLYFENVSMAVLNEDNRPIMARGGWKNMPRVVWDSRSAVTFTLSEGVMSSIGMSILLSTNMTAPKEDEPILINKIEGPYYPESCPWKNEETDNNEETITPVGFFIERLPVPYPKKKTFIFEYDRDVAQKKVYGEILTRNTDFGPQYFLAIYEDKELTTPVKKTKKYLVDYYYEYRDEALIYTIEKERFNGLFTLEGQFYSKDENEGKNYTNLIYMPRVRVVSNIDLRLGERASPTVAVFNIVGLPETTVTGKDGMIMDIQRLAVDVEEEEI